MSVGLVWLAATVVFFILKLASPDLHKAWLAFIFAIPVMFIVTLALSAVWHPWIYRFISVSGIIWTTALALDLSFTLRYMPLIYTIAAAAQALTILWYLPKAIQFFSKHIKIRKEEKKSAAEKTSEQPFDASDKVG